METISPGFRVLGAGPSPNIQYVRQYVRSFMGEHVLLKVGVVSLCMKERQKRPPKRVRVEHWWDKVARIANRISMIFVAGVHTCCTA